ncbi:MAG: hypothetical protein ACI86X_001781 [Moritella sp.]|jgi:hypothetical protein
MSAYFAEIKWTRGADEKYIDNEYSRGHEWNFDGGARIQASSSPHIVPRPFSVEAEIVIEIPPILA